MKTLLRITCIGVALAVSGCATTPNGPSNIALPGTGKDFNLFRADDLSCRDFALGQIGSKTVNQQYNESLATTTAVGTVIGAALGAAAGGGDNAQRKYDNAYLQCMYAAGHRIPVPASMAKTYTQGASSTTITHSQTTTGTPPVRSTYYPPPPPGYQR